MTRPRFLYRQSSRMPQGTTTVRTVPTKADPAPKNMYIAPGGGPADPSTMNRATMATPAQNQKMAIAHINGGMSGGYHIG